ncbi:MAG: hypothetical protein JWL67_2322 [Solirubrobacterales bacterium]|nr:hypothetical protein [Solirubrobacterales bacterium]
MHLVRAANGPEPLAAFLTSYRKHSPGIAHDLVLLFKGFDSPSHAKAYLARVPAVEAGWLFLPDVGFDLDAYVEAARRLQRGRYCFLNSFSTIIADGWLAMLSVALDDPHAGMVAATGSWASQRSHVLHESGVVPGNAYSGIFPDRRWMIEQFDMLRRDQSEETPVRLASMRSRINTWRSIAGAVHGLQGFPAPHLRTNAFLIERDTLARLRLKRARRKIHAYRLESGKRSITRQICELGLRPLVVNREGVSFDCGDWHLSRTFWQGDQEGLLVADNQTTAYDRGDLDRRTVLARLAWGRLADPAPPAERSG